MIKEKLVCSECGTDDILMDAYARWDVETQQFELNSTHEETSCQNEDCDAQVNGYSTGVWVKVDVTYALKWGNIDMPFTDYTIGDERHETRELAEHAANLLRVANQSNPIRLVVSVIEMVSEPIEEKTP
jgi:hypothetical protein